MGKVIFGKIVYVLYELFDKWLRISIVDVNVLDKSYNF